MFLLTAGRQLSDMDNPWLWVMFVLAVLYDMAYFGTLFRVQYLISKVEVGSQKFRELDSFGMIVCLLGMLPFVYIQVFVLIPFGVFDLPE